MVAQFKDVVVGDRLAAAWQILLVTAKDELRIDLCDESDFTRTVSFYPSEFDERAFEAIPAPEPKVRKYASGGLVTPSAPRLIGE